MTLSISISANSFIAPNGAGIFYGNSVSKIRETRSAIGVTNEDALQLHRILRQLSRVKESLSELSGPEDALSATSESKVNVPAQSTSAPDLDLADATEPGNQSTEIASTPTASQSPDHPTSSRGTTSTPAVNDAHANRDIGSDEHLADGESEPTVQDSDDTKLPGPSDAQKFAANFTQVATEINKLFVGADAGGFDGDEIVELRAGIEKIVLGDVEDRVLHLTDSIQFDFGDTAEPVVRLDTNQSLAGSLDGHESQINSLLFGPEGEGIIDRLFVFIADAEEQLGALLPRTGSIVNREV